MFDATKEIWVDVKGFEGLYQISDFGRLKSFKVAPLGQIRSLTNAKGDYLRVVLQGKGVPRKSISIHRLVAEHFLPQPPCRSIVNHIDGNKQNNRADNLEWISQAENVRHSKKYLHPTQFDGMLSYNHQRRRNVYQYNSAGTLLASYESCKEASEKTGICKRSIERAANGERKTAGGSIWKYQGGDNDD